MAWTCRSSGRLRTSRGPPGDGADLRNERGVVTATQGFDTLARLAADGWSVDIMARPPPFADRPAGDDRDLLIRVAKDDVVIERACHHSREVATEIVREARRREQVQQVLDV